MSIPHSMFPNNNLHVTRVTSERNLPKYSRCWTDDVILIEAASIYSIGRCIASPTHPAKWYEEMVATRYWKNEIVDF